ncbi:MAG: uroporphyrinogen decarboxylase family protein [Bacteroidota bacterium]|nr:uroporphyrinogen decarboxylase family protein [Bacteroidota bacterium]
MTHKERFFATISRQPVDRPASWLGLPDTNAFPGLFEYFGVNSVEELKTKIDDDVWHIDVPYHYPPHNHIGCSLNFAKKTTGGSNEERTLTAPGFFENITDLSYIDKFDWPDPVKCIDAEESLRRAKAISPDYVRMGIMWSAHFQDTFSAFGMENSLITMMMAPEMFEAVNKRIVDFYLRANEYFFEATKGYLDAVLIGNDYGSQSGLMIDPDSLRTFAAPGTKVLIEQAKSYGLTVMHHSCGSIFPIVGDIFNWGADIVHPIQALAKDMEPLKLKDEYGSQGAFCGGIDAQNLLVNGTPEQVAQKVRELKRIFPTGLVFSPSHEAILPDIPPANIEALFKTVKE